MFHDLYQPDLTDAELFALMCEYERLQFAIGAAKCGDLAPEALPLIQQRKAELDDLFDLIDFSAR